MKRNILKTKKNSELSAGRKDAARVGAFLRWVGGKRYLVWRLKPYVPENLNGARYHEPFAGAANLYFALAPRKASLSDLNEHLIACYSQIRTNHQKVAAHLREHVRNNSEEYYYEVRRIYNRSSAGPAQAARFIYLNRTCFNGVFRVNTDGEFNVPYGDKSNPIFPGTSDLAQISASLAKARLTACDYERALSKAEQDDFVYLDPPYPPLNGTANFTHYTADRFDSDNQLRLSAAVKQLSKRGVRFLMTNADLPQIRELYRPFHVAEISVTRYVSCKGARHRVGELVITNYAPRFASRGADRRRV